MKLPLVNKLQDFFKIFCFSILLLLFIIIFIIFYLLLFLKKIIIIITIIVIIIIIIIIIFFHTETSPLLQWPPHVCRHEPLTDQQKREGSQSMRFHGLR